MTMNRQSGLSRDDDDVVITREVLPSSASCEFNHLLLSQPLKQEGHTSPPRSGHTAAGLVANSNTFPVPSVVGMPSINPMTSSQGTAVSQQGNRQQVQPGVQQQQMQSLVRPVIPVSNVQNHYVLQPPQNLQRGNRPIIQAMMGGGQQQPNMPPYQSGMMTRPVMTPASATNYQNTIVIGNQRIQAFPQQQPPTQMGTVVRAPHPRPPVQRIPTQQQNNVNIRVQRPILPNVPNTTGFSNGSHPAPVPVASSAQPTAGSQRGQQIRPRVNKSQNAWGVVTREQNGSTTVVGLSGVHLSSAEAVSTRQMSAASGGGPFLKLDLEPRFDVTELIKNTPAAKGGRTGYYKCLACGSLYSSEETLTLHKERKVYRLEYNCPDCHRMQTFNNACALTIHMRTHGKDAPQVDKLQFYSMSKEYLLDALSHYTKPLKAELNRLVVEILPHWDFDMMLPYTRCPMSRKFYLEERAKEEVGEAHSCVMCEYIPKDNDQQNLVQHLLGSRTSDSNYTKCALCSQIVPINRDNVCSFKAHILFHLGIFAMCPRCGFTAPQDLPLTEAEEVMRLHLRFECFHFNLVTIYQCTLCKVTGRAYNNPQQYALHIHDDHATKVYRCTFCSKGSGNNLYESVQLLRTHQELQHQAEMLNSNKSWQIMELKCPDCPQTLPNKNSFQDHYVKFHIRAKGKPAVRCFTTCKQIHRDLEVHRKHVSECAEVKAMVEATPERSYFCLLCGIGVRKKKISTSSDWVTSYQPSYFDSLDGVHEHEASHLIVEGISQTACPWCKEKMEPKVSIVLEHVRIHVEENAFLRNIARQKREYEESLGDTLSCSCGVRLPTYTDLDNHANSETANKSLGVHFALPEHLLSELCTANSTEQQIQCPLCSDKKNSSFLMAEHICKNHKNQACYVCFKFCVANGRDSKIRNKLWKHIFKCIKQRMPSHYPNTPENPVSRMIQNGFAAEDTLSGQEAKPQAERNYVRSNLGGDVNFEDNMNSSVCGSSLSIDQISIDGPGGTSAPVAPLPPIEVAHFECSICQGPSRPAFFTETERSEHTQAEHGTRLCHSCVLCGVKFSTREALARHNVERHERGLRQCGLSAERPVVLETGHSLFTCYMCSQQFEKKHQCEKHLIHIHKLLKTNIEWSRIVESGDSVAKEDADEPAPKRLRSEAVVDEEAVFSCAHCDFSSAHRAALISHMADLHSALIESRNAHMCCDCGTVLTSSRSLELHLRVAHKISDVKAYVKTFKGDIVRKPPPELQLVNGAQIESEARFECRVCPEKFNDEESYARHERTHGLAFLQEHTNTGI